MNGRTAKLLNKLAKNSNHSRRLKRAWNRIPWDEREGVRKELKQKVKKAKHKRHHDEPI